ncbi:2,3-dihydroxybiphenyl 1,2-dioxygenase, partial [Mycobacterium sp. CBMA361]|nr:2,3-dihydroxybiphenyl 1,2-dioxygenase [Mycolicibacterium sp. CBMA 361]
MSSNTIGAHTGLHSADGARKGEHPGRSRNPLIKVADVAWLEFDKPDLARAEAFAHAFGFSTALRTDTELHLRGSDPDAPCVLIRRGAQTRFRGVAFTADSDADLVRLADKAGARVTALPESIGGLGVQLTDPSGMRVQVVSGTRPLRPLPAQTPLTLN